MGTSLCPLQANNPAWISSCTRISTDGVSGTMRAADFSRSVMITGAPFGSSAHPLFVAVTTNIIASFEGFANDHKRSLAMNCQAKKPKPAEVGYFRAIYRPLSSQPDDSSSGGQEAEALNHPLDRR
jgi:hypothetical protein